MSVANGSGPAAKPFDAESARLPFSPAKNMRRRGSAAPPSFPWQEGMASPTPQQPAAVFELECFETTELTAFPLCPCACSRYTDASQSEIIRNDIKERVMPAASNLRLRRIFVQIHLWLGIGLAVLLIPISLSGAALVWHDPFDALFHPARYAATSGQALPPAQLIAHAKAALPAGFQPIALRMPESDGWPVTVSAREGRRGEGARPKLVTVYLDPPTGRVLDTVEFGDSLIGILHRFHENLTIPELNGRSIVGWVGVAMLILSLSGIYLWWPRNVSFLRGLRFTRGPALSFNLHHLFGFWISIPLAVVSATGIYLGFPQTAREMMAQVAPISQPQRGGGGANAGAGVRVQIRDPQTGDRVTMTLDERSGALTPATTQLSGDRAALLIRGLHEGSRGGALWQLLVFVCGVLPTVFVITGVLIWFRSRKRPKPFTPITPAMAVPQVEAAE
jgi:uncharacterized iron-regulated membrane protein